MKKPKSKKAVHYFTDLEKEAIFEKLRLNNGNILQTSIQTGISRNTLSKWITRQKFDEKVEPKKALAVAKKERRPNKNETAVVVPEIPTLYTLDQIVEASKNVSDYFTTLKVVRDMTLKQLMNRIPFENNLDFLTKLVFGISKQLETAGDQDKTPNETTLNVAINNIENHFHNSGSLLADIQEEWIKSIQENNKN